jgi:hypothetical protein
MTSVSNGDGACEASASALDSYLRIPRLAGQNMVDILVENTHRIQRNAKALAPIRLACRHSSSYYHNSSCKPFAYASQILPKKPSSVNHLCHVKLSNTNQPFTWVGRFLLALVSYSLYESANTTPAKRSTASVSDHNSGIKISEMRGRRYVAAG